jgi:hypothetical protein
MTQKGFAISDSDKRLIRDNTFYVREALFACTTEAQVECSVAFARYLNRSGINGENFLLFLRLVMTNNPWVIDELLHEREARLLFSTIRPDQELIDVAFQTLYSRHPEELYPRALEALLGIIESAYFDPDDGYRIRKLSITDINALGKFLLQDNVQNRLILDILDRITHLGEYYGEQDKSVLSKHAFNVRFAYFDTTRELVDAIPHPLLVHVPDHGKVRPEEDYMNLVAARRARKRDSSGRFVRELPASAPLEGSAIPEAGAPGGQAGPGGAAATPSPREAPPVAPRQTPPSEARGAAPDAESQVEAAEKRKPRAAVPTAKPKAETGNRGGAAPKIKAKSAKPSAGGKPTASRKRPKG